MKATKGKNTKMLIKQKCSLSLSLKFIMHLRRVIMISRFQRGIDLSVLIFTLQIKLRKFSLLLLMEFTEFQLTNKTRLDDRHLIKKFQNNTGKNRDELQEDF